MGLDREFFVALLVLLFIASLIVIQYTQIDLLKEHASTKHALTNDTGENWTLVPVKPGEVKFEKEEEGFVQCPKGFWVEYEHYTSENQPYNRVNFTILFNGIPRANITLEGVEGKRFCIPEGIIVYSYYPENGISSLALFNYNFTLVWMGHYLAPPEKYYNGSLILQNDYCLYLVNASTGSVSREFCPDVPRPRIAYFKIVEGKIYVIVGSLKHPGLTRVMLYVLYRDREKAVNVTVITEVLPELRASLDVSDKYVAIAYYLHHEWDGEKNGLCVFKRNTLEKIACREFKEGYRPLKVKLEGNVVYALTSKGVEAYRILETPKGDES